VKESGCSPCPATDDQIIETISVPIKPGNPRTQAAEVMWEQGLSRKIIKRFIDMFMPEERTHVLEQWFYRAG
jgi:hypothetical protein